MHTSVPYLMEGQIVSVMPDDGHNNIRYICQVVLPNGSSTLLANVISGSMFGGIGDYMQIRHRSTTDESSSSTSYAGNTFNPSDQSNVNNSKIGDRVIIACLNADIRRPVIIGYLPHPNQTFQFEDYDPVSLKPQTVVRYLGLEFIVDEDGQVQIIHNGAPEVSEVANATPTVPSTPDAGDNDNNPALIAQPSTERTIVELLAGGIYRVRDADGQIIEINRDKKRIYISNNNLKSTDDISDSALSSGQSPTDDIDAESILLDEDKQSVMINARKIAQVHSLDQRHDITDGNFINEVNKNATLTVKGDQGETIKGSLTENITGSWTITVANNKIVVDTNGISIADVTGNKVVTSKSGVKISEATGAGANFSSGKAAIGGKGGELFDIVNKILTQLDKILMGIERLTVGTALGPSSVPINVADFIAAQTELKAVATSISLVKGTL